MFSHDDSGSFETVDQIRVDTGSNGFLSVPLSHSLTDGMWISAEYGERRGTVLRSTQRNWRGVGTAFAVAGIEYRPVLVDVSDSVLGSPLLGQEWFDLADATWIDPTGGLLAVSFRPDASDELLIAHPDAWVSLPWRSVRPGGHRFIPVEMGGIEFEALIDTGKSGELFLDVHHPPRFALKPWGRSRVLTPTGTEGPLWGATSGEPLLLDGFAVSGPFVTWFGTRSTTLPRTLGDRPFAILGLDFLRRYPVLLDPKNERVHFFVGDRATLRPPGCGTQTTPGD